MFYTIQLAIPIVWHYLMFQICCVINKWNKDDNFTQLFLSFYSNSI
jgi:hypothetical protein